MGQGWRKLGPIQFREDWYDKRARTPTCLGVACLVMGCLVVGCGKGSDDTSHVSEGSTLAASTPPAHEIALRGGNESVISLRAGEVLSLWSLCREGVRAISVRGEKGNFVHGICASKGQQDFVLELNHGAAVASLQGKTSEYATASVASASEIFVERAAAEQDKTANKGLVIEIEGVEYLVDTGDWQDSSPRERGKRARFKRAAPIKSAAPAKPRTLRGLFVHYASKSGGAWPREWSQLRSIRFQSREGLSEIALTPNLAQASLSLNKRGFVRMTYSSEKGALRLRDLRRIEFTSKDATNP